jgi:peptidoglycan-associated lipoprotein
MKKIFLLFVMGVFVVGCAAKKQMIKPVEDAAPVQAAAPVKTDDQSSRFSDWQNVPELESAYFAFDKSELLPAAREALKANADYLKANEKYDILIEGNCDERGTIAYNLALGERRASAVREYYGVLGVPVNRIAVISYGSEKPVDPGHNETAWGKNRRAETKIRNAKSANAISDTKSKNVLH